MSRENNPNNKSLTVIPQNNLAFWSVGYLGWCAMLAASKFAGDAASILVKTTLVNIAIPAIDTAASTVGTTVSFTVYGSLWGIKTVVGIAANLISSMNHAERRPN